MSVGKVIVRMGSVPNLPWWKLMHMTDSEIEEFNNKHKSSITEDEMTDKDIEKQVNNPNHKYAREVWNAALDKAASECDKVLECKAAARIRELKK